MRYKHTQRWKVGVFSRPSRRHPFHRIGFRAYVRNFNPAWPHCCVHLVYAFTGEGAKIAAIAQCREECHTGRHDDDPRGSMDTRQ